MILRLTRFCDSPEMGVFGTLELPDGLKLYTVERPWKNNIPYYSCVPDGDYKCEPYDSPKFGNVYILRNPDLGVDHFPGQAKRSGILIHPANRSSELLGCIAPGTSLTRIKTEWAVGSSKSALSTIRLTTGYRPFELQIRWKRH